MGFHAQFHPIRPISFFNRGSRYKNVAAHFVHVIDVTNRSTVGVMLRGRWSDDRVVGEMPEIGKVLVGELDRCRERKESKEL